VLPHHDAILARGTLDVEKFSSARRSGLLWVDMKAIARTLAVVGWAVAGALGLAAGQGGCHEPDPCHTGACGCRGGDRCDLVCDVSPCDVECGELDQCNVECVDDCTIACADVSDCDLACGADCVIACDRLSGCDASCGERCDYACRDVSGCNVVVGPDSTVVCERIGDCNVQCEGACDVTCSNVGNCSVACGDGSSAPVEDGHATCV
jgi:hypothetical protein